MQHIERNAQKSNATLAICITALFMALNIMMSSFGLPVPGGHLYLNDVIICTAAVGAVGGLVLCFKAGLLERFDKMFRK